MQIGQKFWPARSANTLEITQKNFHASKTNIGEIIWGPWGGGAKNPGFPPLQIPIPISFKSAQGASNRLTVKKFPFAKCMKKNIKIEKLLSYSRWYSGTFLPWVISPVLPSGEIKPANFPVDESSYRHLCQVNQLSS